MKKKNYILEIKNNLIQLILKIKIKTYIVNIPNILFQKEH